MEQPPFWSLLVLIVAIWQGIVWLYKWFRGRNIFLRYHKEFQKIFTCSTYSFDVFSIQKSLTLAEKYTLNYDTDLDFVCEFIDHFEKHLAYSYLGDRCAKLKQDLVFGYEYMYFRSLASFCKCLLLDNEFDKDLGVKVDYKNFFNYYELEYMLRERPMESECDGWQCNKYKLTDKGKIICKIGLIAYEKQLRIVKGNDSRRAKKYADYGLRAASQAEEMKCIIDEESVIKKLRPLHSRSQEFLKNID